MNSHRLKDGGDIGVQISHDKSGVLLQVGSPTNYEPDPYEQVRIKLTREEVTQLISRLVNYMSKIEDDRNHLNENHD